MLGWCGRSWLVIEGNDRKFVIKLQWPKILSCKGVDKYHTWLRHFEIISILLTNEKNSKKIRYIVSLFGCKQDIMSQHDYFRKGLYVFFPKLFFFIWMNFGTIFFQLFIINAYSSTITQHVFIIIFLINMNFWKCPYSL